MDATGPIPSTNATPRRDFLKQSAWAAGAALASGVSTPLVHAAGSDVLKIGLIGCGGRGTGAGAQAMAADPNCELVALADMFPDRLESSRAELEKIGGPKFKVTKEKSFVGVDAYKQLIDSDVDVVVMAAPPHFRPAHIQYAVEKGKHIFAEKPVAVDGPGVRSVFESCRKAQEKGLSLVSGLCWRYDLGMRETVRRVKEGAIGDIIALQCNYNTGELWHKPRQPNWSDMEWQLRNWLYFTWLSGDHNVEQHIHSLDKVAWVMNDEYPVRCVGLGGRQARTQPEFGHIFDHHAVCYEFANGVRCYSFCRQQNNTAHDVDDYVFGSKGRARLIAKTIEPKDGTEWKYRTDRKAAKTNMYQQEHDELFASIRSGKPINDGDYMTKSTLMAIMGRMATYTGQEVTWEQALQSKEDLTPASYAFGPIAVPPVAIPGMTALV